MCRSKRSSPITGITTAVSEKSDQRAANRVLRRVTWQDIRTEGADHDMTPLLREMSNPWSMDKEGSAASSTLPPKTTSKVDKF
jgi:hypothetical protein